MWPFGSSSPPADDLPQLITSIVPTTPSTTIAPLETGELATPILTEKLQPYIRQPSDRLGLHPAIRFFTVGVVTFTTGFILGAAEGGNTASFRYRAENAHRLPTSKAGWYLYGKSKGYHTIVGGVTQGIKTGFRFTGWATLFMAIEEGLDRARGRAFASARDRELGVLAHGQRDFLNTTSAAIALAGIHSWMNNLDRFSATRMTKLALKFAVPFGLAQDALASLRGERPRYVDWILGRSPGRVWAGEKI